MSGANNWTIREATPADAEAIRALNKQAFDREDEANIVRQLEADGDVIFQLVAHLDGAVVGHLLFYPMGVFGKLGAVGLGPMCVEPWVQKEGIGSSMVHYGLTNLKANGVPLVFVLGHPEYYPRFGFSQEAAANFQSPIRDRAGPAFMAVRLRYGPPMSGRLIFPRAFGIPISPP